MSLQSFAADVEFQVSPTVPIIITSDLSIPNKATVYAPWFQALYLIGNGKTENITVTSLSFKVTSAEGWDLQQLEQLPAPVTLPPHGFFQVKDLYLGSLPKS